MSVIVNDQPREIEPGTTLSGLLGEMELDSRLVAVEVNLQVVPRGRHSQCTLCEGDRLEIVTLVGGG